MSEKKKNSRTEFITKPENLNWFWRGGVIFQQKCLIIYQYWHEFLLFILVVQKKKPVLFLVVY